MNFRARRRSNAGNKDGVVQGMIAGIRSVEASNGRASQFQLGQVKRKEKRKIRGLPKRRIGLTQGGVGLS